jgi:hypothetical protein
MHVVSTMAHYFIGVCFLVSHQFFMETTRMPVRGQARGKSATAPSGTKVEPFCVPVPVPVRLSREPEAIHPLRGWGYLDFTFLRFLLYRGIHIIFTIVA